MTYTLYKVRDRSEPGVVLYYWTLIPPQSKSERVLRKVEVKVLPKYEGMQKLGGKRERVNEIDVELLREEAWKLAKLAKRGRYR
jgi:hypothetical protein